MFGKLSTAGRVTINVRHRCGHRRDITVRNDLGEDLPRMVFEQELCDDCFDKEQRRLAKSFYIGITLLVIMGACIGYLLAIL